MTKIQKASGHMAAGLLAVMVCLSAVADESNKVVAPVTNLPPGLILRDLGGQYVKLNDLCYPGEDKPRLPRQTLVLDFMASDCAPCRKELPDILAFLRDNKTNGVAGYLISLDQLSKGERLEQFLAEMKVDCGVLLDPYMIAAKKMGVVDKDGGGGIPRTFVVAPDGRIVADINGKADDIRKRMEEAVEKARP